MSIEHPIILFDGVCNLCNSSVQFILRYEKKPEFKFVALQSETGNKIRQQFQEEDISDSVLLIENNKLFQASDAALRIAKKLKYFWILYYLIYLPNWMRDPFYRFVASNRYHWFGKRDQCMIPDESVKNRFL